MPSDDDFHFMTKAIALANRGLFTTDPNPRVGCVLVKDNVTVGEGWHERAGGPHAEINALKQAGDKAHGATAYISLEPCCHHGRTPPCTDALIKAGVSRVVGAMSDPNPEVSDQGYQQLDAAGISVEKDVLKIEAETLNPGYLRRMRQGRPYVRCKLAMSLDGRTAMASGESKWITSEDAREDVHYLRARSSAIVTGIGTVQADDPSMTARLDEKDITEVQQPLRVVLDTKLAMSDQARMLGLDGDTLIITTSQDKTVQEKLTNAGARIEVVAKTDNHVDLQAVMKCLADRQINEVLLEAGATLSGAMLQAGLIDELIVYIAPHLMGDNARGLFHLPGLDKMDQRIEFDIIETVHIGQDCKITARPKLVS